MSEKVNLGGGRLQSGSKIEVELPHYERSTHDLTSVMKTTMSPGTVVPIMGLLAQNEDTFDIEYDVDIQTEPTLGALYGSFKFQIDTFKTPISLYNGLLLINETDFDAKKIFLPVARINGKSPNVHTLEDLDNYQINPSSIFKYMGISGIGFGFGNPAQGSLVSRDFQILKWLIYWDVWKNYYANKQETNGWVIHTEMTINTQVSSVELLFRGGTFPITQNTGGTPVGFPRPGVNGGQVEVTYSGGAVQENTVVLILSDGRELLLQDMFEYSQIFVNTVTYSLLKPEYVQITVDNWRFRTPDDMFKSPPKLVSFPISNIDFIRRSILTNLSSTQPYLMDVNGVGGAQAPYSYALMGNVTDGFSAAQSQEGLAVKTYQSDKFNNWLKTEYITGIGGVNELSRIDVSSGWLEIEALNLGKKVYKMLNAVAAADKTYTGYQKAIWGGEGNLNETSPVFIGGLSKEIGFQEVISTGGAEALGGTEPLGTIVGRGKLTDRHNGGRVSVKIWSPSYVTAYASITPYISYSQGNEWDMNYKTLDDWHKPALDQIGFEDRVTDEMAWWDTWIDNTAQPNGPITYKSAGKQPAWLDYMTDYDRVYGNFAIENNMGWMVLNRRYERSGSGATAWSIKDLTTYIDPSKFNHIFAQASLDAMNFRVMIRKRITARRKISAKVMPNA